MWTTTEAARELGYNPNYIRQLCRTKKLACRRNHTTNQWMILSLEYTPNKTKIHKNRGLKITMNFLKKVNPKSYRQKEAIGIVISMLNTENLGRIQSGYASNKVLEYIDNHKIIYAKDMPEALGLNQHAILNVLYRCVKRNIIARIGVGKYERLR